MNLFNPVSTIMRQQLITLEASDSIAEAGRVFQENNIHHIPILERGKLVGIVSLGDFLFFRRGFLDNEVDEVLEDIRLQNYTVSHIMTSGLAKLEPSDKIVVALDLFQRNIFRAVPVVKDNTLIGLVTTHDIITNLAKDNVAIAAYE